MKTVNFLYGKTTLDLEVPDDTPVLTSNIDELRAKKAVMILLQRPWKIQSTALASSNSPKANRIVRSLSAIIHARCQARTFFRT